MDNQTIDNRNDSRQGYANKYIYNYSSNVYEGRISYNDVYRIIKDVKCDNSLLQQLCYCSNPNGAATDDNKVSPKEEDLRGLNESQKQAIKNSLNRPLSVIIGPPGTGKTHTIARLVEYLAKKNNTVAIVSSNNAAIDNVITALQTDVPIARLGNKWNIKDFIESIKSYDEDFQTTLSNWAKYLDDKKNNQDKRPKATAFCKKYPIITSTLHSLASCFNYDLTDSQLYFHFDYVIIDEASQCTPLLGAIAAGFGKHLVVVGDPKQLPPVVDETKFQMAYHQWEYYCSEETQEKDREKFINLWFLRPDWSFLDLVLCLLTGFTKEEYEQGIPWKKINHGQYPGISLLNTHYRCHPQIIGFCNQQMYGSQLTNAKKLLAEERSLPPFQVRWFDGNYCEATTLNERGTFHNCKEVEIFLHEELPRLKTLLENNPELTVCFLSPYRGQIAKIKEALQSMTDLKDRQLLVADDLTTCPQPNSEASKQSPQALFWTQENKGSTVHAVQGQEFDLVYFFPVDNKTTKWDNPWSQSERLINVMVSRAKKQLCIIASSGLMARDLRDKIGAKHPITDSKEPTTLTKLLSYIYEQSPQYFQKSSLLSVFDNFEETQEESPRPSYPERLMAKTLLQELQLLKAHYNKEYNLYSEVPFNKVLFNEASSNLEPQLPRRFDFLITNAENKAILAIEVDGAYHRQDKTQQEKDEERDKVLKDQGVQLLTPEHLKEKDKFLKIQSTFSVLRLPTDGSTFGETRQLYHQGRATIADLLLKLDTPPATDETKNQQSTEQKTFIFSKDNQNMKIFCSTQEGFLSIPYENWIETLMYFGYQLREDGRFVHNLYRKAPSYELSDSSDGKTQQ